MTQHQEKDGGMRGWMDKRCVGRQGRKEEGTQDKEKYKTGEEDIPFVDAKFK